MNRALFLVIVSCLAVSTVTCQKPAKVAPKHYKVTEVGATGSVSSDGRFLTYTDWSTGDLAVLDLKTRENQRLTNKGSWLESSDFALFSTLSPKGKQVAYGWSTLTSWDLRIIGVDGFSPQILYRSEETTYLEPWQWSPDGQRILTLFVTKDGTSQIVLVSVADGSVRVVKTLDWRHPVKLCLSPDGRHILYDYPPQVDSPARDIFLLQVDSGREVHLVKHPANDLPLGWAPDGTSVLFASDRRGTLDAWIIQVVDGRPRGRPQLVKRGIGPTVAGLGFTEDASFYYGVSTWENDVYVVSLDSETGKLHAPKKLVSHVAHDSSPAWSPDGRTLAYVEQRGASPSDLYSLALVIRSVQTGNERALPPLKMRRFHAVQPQWLPDGRFLFAQGRDYKGRQGLYRIDAQTGEISPLVQADKGPLEWPALSSKGNLVFTRYPEGSAFPLIIVARDLETGEEKELYREASPASVSRLAISPDAQRLAFVWRDVEKGITAVKVMPTTGAEPHELLSVQRPESILVPAWMPDSRHIIYAVSSAGQKPKFDLWRIAAKGGEPENLGLVMEGLLPYGLSVHPDGRRIAFTAGTEPREETWVLKDFLPAQEGGGEK